MKTESKDPYLGSQLSKTSALPEIITCIWPDAHGENNCRFRIAEKCKFLCNVLFSTNKLAIKSGYEQLQ
jgi:hypothetical protein